MDAHECSPHEKGFVRACDQANVYPASPTVLADFPLNKFAILAGFRYSVEQLSSFWGDMKDGMVDLGR